MLFTKLELGHPPAGHMAPKSPRGFSHSAILSVLSPFHHVPEMGELDCIGYPQQALSRAEGQAAQRAARVTSLP